MSFNTDGYLQKGRTNDSPRRGATYTVDMDGNPVRPRYLKNGKKSVDTVRLPPVLVGRDIATPAVRKDRTDGRVRVASEIDSYKDFKQISKATQDRYKQIKEDFILKQQLEELEREIRRRQEDEAKYLDLQRKPARKNKSAYHRLPVRVPCDASIKDKSASDIDSDDNFDDILLTPEPSRQTRKHIRRSSTVTSSLGSQTTRADAHVSASQIELENEILSEFSHVDACAKTVKNAERRLAKYKASTLGKTVNQSTPGVSGLNSASSSVVKSSHSNENTVADDKPSLRKRIWNRIKKTI